MSEITVWSTENCTFAATSQFPKSCYLGVVCSGALKLRKLDKTIYSTIWRRALNVLSELFLNTSFLHSWFKRVQAADSRWLDQTEFCISTYVFTCFNKPLHPYSIFLAKHKESRGSSRFFAVLYFHDSLPCDGKTWEAPAAATTP